MQRGAQKGRLVLAALGPEMWQWLRGASLGPQNPFKHPLDLMWPKRFRLEKLEKWA